MDSGIPPKIFLLQIISYFYLKPVFKLTHPFFEIFDALEQIREPPHAGQGFLHPFVRLGRKTYLVDLATAETRSSYTAVSNTVLGLFLLAGGGLGVIDTLYGTATVLFLLLGTCVLATLFCLSLKPVD